MIIRKATHADVPDVEALIEASIRGIGAQRYSPEQIESSLEHLFGADTQMIDDGTYFVVEAEGALVGAGGWSARKTPFGGDQAAAVRDAQWRDPAEDPAVIRAFYVHPDWTRRGIGQRLLAASEDAARAEGFHTFELVATLTGLPLYAAAGYREVKPTTIPLPDGVVIEAVRMKKVPDAA
jgi:predicted N-acetyltransferase YhbS